jgi:DNA mismatch endonuclease, patch repair protein
MVFPAARVVVFCDGDFWHGRNLQQRISKLERGHNAPYWVAKIQRNAERDRFQTELLQSAGWLVLRFWETDILKGAPIIADAIVAAVRARMLASRESDPTKSRQPRVRPSR